jgi:FkbM family methyltransferase
MREILNIKGKLAPLISTVCGFRLLQPLYEAAYLFCLLCMNVGSATYGYGENGEVRVMKLIKDHFNQATDPIVIFDVGAHRGHYATDLARVFGERSRIYCFEPSAPLFADLKTCLGTFPNFELYQLGLSDKDESVELYDYGYSIPSMVSDVVGLAGGRAFTVENVSTVRLDQFCKEHQVERINFLKVDVEGYDLKVLKGAKEMLSSANVDFVQFEFGAQSISPRSFLHDFYELLGPDFDMYRILRYGLYPLRSYDPKYEIFVSATNYLAIHKSISSRMPK